MPLPCRTRAVVGFDVGDSPFSKISRTRAGPPGLIADFDRSCIDFAPRQLRVVQNGVRRPCELCEVAHQFALARLRSLRTRQVGQRTKKASFQKTLAIHVAGGCTLRVLVRQDNRIPDEMIATWENHTLI